MLHPTSRFNAYHFPPTYLSRTSTNVPMVPTAVTPTLRVRIPQLVAIHAHAIRVTKAMATLVLTSMSVLQTMVVVPIFVPTRMVASSARVEPGTPLTTIALAALPFISGLARLFLRPRRLRLRPPIPLLPSSPLARHTRLPATILMLLLLNLTMPLLPMTRLRTKPLRSPRRTNRLLPTKPP